MMHRIDKFTLWGVGLLFFGVFCWGMPDTSLASHVDPNANYDPDSFVGAPRDRVADHTPDKPGADYDLDRTPDRAARDFKISPNPDGVNRTRDRGTNMDRVGIRDGVEAGELDLIPDRDQALVRDRGRDNDPDCADGAVEDVNIPGDGNCGKNPFQGDNLPDSFAAGDDRFDNTPDRPIAAGFDRVGDSVRDFVPERGNRDTFLIRVGEPNSVNDRVGIRDCTPADVALGECDRQSADLGVRDNFRDREGRDGTNHDRDRDNSETAGSRAGDSGIGAVPGSGPGDGDQLGGSTAHGGNAFRLGQDGTPDRDRAANADNPRRPGRDRVGARDGAEVGELDFTPDQNNLVANRDRTPDGTFSRTDRDRGQFNHASASRDAFDFGPGDRTRDNKSDSGGLGFEVAAAPPVTFSGCSFSPDQKADPMGAISYLLTLLLPVAVIQLRYRLLRRLRRSN